MQGVKAILIKFYKTAESRNAKDLKSFGYCNRVGSSPTKTTRNQSPKRGFFYFLQCVQDITRDNKCGQQECYEYPQQFITEYLFQHYHFW